MPSKYDRILPKLPGEPVADAPYQQKVDDVKAHVRWVQCPSFHLPILTSKPDPLCCPDCGAPVVSLSDAVLPSALAKEYARLRAERARLDKMVYTVNLHIEAFTQLLIASQEANAEGWGQYGGSDSTLRCANGDKVEVRPEPYGKVVDKEAFRLWCVAPADKCMTCGERESAPWHVGVDSDPARVEGVHTFKPGGGYERQMQLWPTTMNAIVKERLMAGDNPPDGTEAYRRDKVVFTPMKKEPVDEAVRHAAESEVL